MKQTDETVVEQPEIQLDPIKLQAFRNQMEGEQNLPIGAAAGLVAALAGALVRAVVTVITKYQIG